jgi:lipoate-protein ligase B
MSRVSPTDWSHFARGSSSLRVYLLGTVDFQAFQALQEVLAEDVAAGNGREGVLLACEHPPLVTIGRGGSLADILVDDRGLASRQLTVRQVPRGGGTWIHRPGQLVLAPIVPLDRLGLGVAAFRDRLCEAVRLGAEELKIPVEQTTAPAGVSGRYGQFAFVGTLVRSWVSHYGVYINVALPEGTTRPVRWGAADERVTSLSDLRHRPVSMPTAREVFVRRLAAALGYETYHLFTGHPQLRPTWRKSYVHTEV